MLRNYFKIAFRNLKRNQAYPLISILGLALGIACTVFIFFLVNYRLEQVVYSPCDFPSVQEMKRPFAAIIGCPGLYGLVLK